MRRIAASGLTAVIAVAFVVSAIAQGGGPKAALFVLPNLLSSAAVAAMLLLSLANRPSVVDDGWGILAGSFAVSNMYVLVPLLGPFLFSTHPLAALQRVAVVGTLATLPLYLVAVLTLGRNLTVLPEANALQTRGVYALSRHPLYAIYILWYALQVLLCQTVAVVGLAALQIALQLFRARREEQVLGAAFPEYAAYRERVAWVGPTLHVRRGLRGVISRGV